jgi:hypothetical protein
MLGLAELEVVVSAVDSSEAAVGETDGADNAVGVEAVVPEAEAEAEDAFLISMVKADSPVYDCTVLSPDVVVVRSSLEMVKVPLAVPCPN